MSLSVLDMDTDTEHCHKCARQGKKYFFVSEKVFMDIDPKLCPKG